MARVYRRDALTHGEGLGGKRESPDLVAPVDLSSIVPTGIVVPRETT